jgi:hypothetical protein
MRMVSPGLVKALTKSKKASQLKGILKKIQIQICRKGKDNFFCAEEIIMTNLLCRCGIWMLHLVMCHSLDHRSAMHGSFGSFDSLFI